MRSTNPFHILGLRVELLQGLSDLQIHQIIKSQFRTLSMLYHPDTGGDRNKFQEIVWADDQLDVGKNPETYAHWKYKLKATRKNQVDDLTRRVEVAEDALDVLTLRLMDCWQALAHPTDFGLSVPLIRNRRFLMSDTLDCVLRMRSLEQRAYGHGSGLRSSFLPGNAYDIDVDHKGRIYRAKLEKTEFDDRADIPDLPNEWVEVRMQKGRSYYWNRVEEPVELVGYKLVGALDHETMAPLKGRRTSIGELITGPALAGCSQVVEGGFTVAEFMPMMQFMRPFMRFQDFLIAGKSDGKQMKFLVLGQARHSVKLKMKERI